MSDKPVFSRKMLNILIFVTAILILVLSQLGDKTTLKDVSSFHGKDADDATTEISADDSSDTTDATKTYIKDYFPELSAIPDVPDVDIKLDIQHWTNDQGLKVFFVKAPEIPMADIRLIFDAGSARDGAEHAGLAGMTADLIESGAENLNVDQVAQELEKIGAEMETGSYRDMAIASLRVLVDQEYMKSAIQLYTNILGHMEFTDEDLLREQNRLMVGIARKAQSPQALIGDEVFNTLYGAQHPYGYPSSGTMDTVKSITRENIENFHSKYYVTENASLAIVGDLTRQQAEDIANQISGSLGRGKSADKTLPGTQNVKDVIRHIDFPSDQTHIAMVGPGVKRGDEDYYALFVADNILGGGGFASLLNKKIRQEKAFAYSVGSSVSPMAGVGPISIQMQTRGDQAAAAIEATKQVIDKLAENGPTDAMMKDVKQQILSEFAMRAASNSAQLGYLGSIGFYDLPLDYLSIFNQKIEAVTADDVKKMVSKYYKNLGIITLGRTDPFGSTPVTQ